ncbi:dTDP-glucose 4,6-dehydratase 2 [Buchnera aphidicola (Neophyllaphis podocarpi)]|uniref:GDP-mannose 4,6-dehydratase n=1 Tax=Buchnera aphidicola TaxID=9 RepID=UPI00346432E9
MNIIITGGSRFISLTLAKYIINFTNDKILLIDNLKCTKNLNLFFKTMIDKDRISIFKTDLEDKKSIDYIFLKFHPHIIINIEYDYNINNKITDYSNNFIRNNFVNTLNLLECSKNYWNSLDIVDKKTFKFNCIFKSDVYYKFNILNVLQEISIHDNINPYLISKSLISCLMSSWYFSYKLPIIITNISNHYGPLDFSNTLISKSIFNALLGKKIVLNKDNIFEINNWLYIDDYVRSLYNLTVKGDIGYIYNIRSYYLSNIRLLKIICYLLNILVKIKPVGVSNFFDLIVSNSFHQKSFLNNNFIYNIINTKIESKIDKNFKNKIVKTIKWYIKNIELLNSFF